MIVRRVLTLLLFVALANVVVFVAEATVYTPFRVPTDSMRPGLERGDRIAVDHTVRIREIERGDLIVFAVSARFDPGAKPAANFPSRTSTTANLLVKRVVGLPGETVEAKQGVIAINETNRLPEPYVLADRAGVTFPLVKLDDEEVWVMGDNRHHSRDSRAFGPVPARAIVGRVSFRYWPIHRGKWF